MSKTLQALLVLVASAAVGSGMPGTFSPCDVNQDGVTNVADVQALVNQALGTKAAAADLNADGVVNVADIQIDIDAALGLGCSVGTVGPAGPTIVDFNPKTGPIGTSVVITGGNFLSSPIVTMPMQGGGTIVEPVSASTSGSLTFVLAAGSASGAIAVSNGLNTSATASPFTVTPSTTFNLSAAPAAGTLIQGQSVTYALTVNSSSGFSQLASLSVSGAPTGVTTSISPQSITTGQTAVLTLTAPAGQPVGGPVNLSVQATATVEGIAISQTAPVAMSVVAPTTSFLGRTVVSNAVQTPLAGVTVSTMGLDGSGNSTGCTGHSVISDAAGNFALTNLPTFCIGPQLISFNGNTVTSPAGTYAGVNLVFTLVSGQVVNSPVLVNLPQVNNVETFMLQQNSPANQTYTFQTIPGLQVTVYAHTTFTESDGSQPNPFPLAAINVPVDRLPDQMPLTNSMVSAFIVAFQPANTVTSQAVAVWFPNTLNTPPGTEMPLMTLNPTLGRMVPYGTGSVSSDGTTIIPDIDPSTGSLMHRFGIVHFDWHGPVPPGPPRNPKKGPGSGGTVDLSSGLETYSRTDIAIQGNRGALAIVRTYRMLSNEVGPFGLGADFNYNMRLDNVAPQTAATVNLIMQDGNRVPFARQPNGQLECKTDPHTVAAIMQTHNDGTATVTFKDGTIFGFEPGGYFFYGSVLVSVTDPNGNVTSINRNPASLNLITSITDPVGRALQFTYNAVNLVTKITDPVGRSVTYTYDSSSNMTSVTDANGGIWRYQYDSQNRLIQTTDARGIVMYRNSYDSSGRVSQQITADGSTQEFTYVVTNPLVAASPVVQTTVTDQLGHRTIYRFNTAGYVVNVTDATGQTQTFARDAQTNLLLQVFGSAICAVCTDPATGGFSYNYDSAGNPTTETNGLGNTWVNTFDPITNQVLTRSDPLGNVTQFGYDGRGNIVLFKDQAGNTYHYTYDENGLLLSETDPSGAVARNSYDAAGNLVAVTDALGYVTRYAYDAVSRQVGVQDPLGDTKTFTYDALDRMTSVTDANGRTIQLAFDPIGGLISITDAANHTTTYTRDIMDRITRRTDPLGRTAQYTYDAIGNMTSLSDRLGNSQSFGYDALYRLTSETYSDATVSRTYDANNRLVQMHDSQAGVFTFSYDGVGRILKAVTPLGAITFTRDRVGRVLTRTVSGQQPQTLTYDAVGNIKSASMGQASVQMSYDVRNLRTAITRSNGVKTTLTYDAGGRLVSRATATGGTNLNTLGYTYDALGRRASISNDLGQPFATQTAASGSYDVSNELLALGSTSYTNDANGNRLTANSPTGNTSYTWDGRGRLSGVVTSGQTISLLYDPAGNLIRSQLTSGSGTTTQTYLLDSLGNIAYQGGSNAAQQFSMLTGGTIDEYFAAVDSSGEAHFGLLGNLGAAVANSGSSGGVDGTASFEPYGQTAETGSTYPIGYNGQIQISPNLYYFRTRFYDAVAGRFLSEDTAGFIGGWNLYEYGQNNPVNLSDPSGQYAGIDDGVAMAGGAIAGVVGQGIGDLLSGSSPAWEDYVGAAVGGAAAGEATLYSGPIIGGAAGGEVGNLVKQGLKNLTKKQCGFDPNSFLYDAVTGGLVGAIPGAEIPGITTGRNSWGAIAKSASTKVENGTVSNVAAATYGKALGANLGEAAGQTISAGATGGVGNEAFPAPECK